jgi:hypothetical protein
VLKQTKEGITMKEQTLYFTNWNYNAARILQRLEKLITDNGGVIASTYENSFNTLYTLHNRTLSGAIREQGERVQRLEELNRDASVAREKLQELEIVNCPPLKTRFTTWISFILDNVYYNLSLDDNPFFPFHLQKIKVNDLSYTGDFYMEEIKKEWLFDCLLSFHCTNDEIKEITNLLFNELQAAPLSGEYIETTRKRVPNLYNNGYHYETITTRNKRTKTLYIFEEV